jgi:hypothetical protein
METYSLDCIDESLKPLKVFNFFIGAEADSTVIFNNIFLDSTNFTWLVKFSFPWINYHLATDVFGQDPVNYDKTFVNNVRSTGEGWDIYAPEDGIFWVFNSTTDRPIPLDDNSEDKLACVVQYANITTDYGSGLIGIFVTNPESPRKGRVYLLCHMGSKQIGETEVPYKNEYLMKGYSNYPYSRSTAIKVKKGNWIGKTGIRGGALVPHIHLEVLEYFDPVYDSRMTDIVFKPDNSGMGWRRINPYSCFDSSLFRRWIDWMDDDNKVIDAFNIQGVYDNNKKIDLQYFIQTEFIEN